jgi:hypothetical protein
MIPECPLLGSLGRAGILKRACAFGGHSLALSFNSFYQDPVPLSFHVTCPRLCRANNKLCLRVTLSLDVFASLSRVCAESTFFRINLIKAALPTVSPKSSDRAR